MEDKRMKLKRIPISLNNDKIYLQVPKYSAYLVYVYKMDKFRYKPYRRYIVHLDGSEPTQVQEYEDKDSYVDDFKNQSDEFEIYRFDNDKEAETYFNKLKMAYKLGK